MSGFSQLLALTMQRSMRPLQMLVLITVIVMLIFATLAYYAERGSYDETLGWVH